MKLAVVSCSLDPDSRSRILASRAHELLKASGADVDWIDLADIPLPLCDGGACYGNQNARAVKERLREARGILMGVPIYNFDVSSAAKNLIELTGRDVWTGKVAGFLCAAGGRGSYMSIMQIAGSLMLDFRTVIIPRFVYATGSDFAGDQIIGEDVLKRIDSLTADLVRFTDALCT
ncbi:MAG: NAD(P)H-dependent oxidoreductase [Phycisphaerales bacterium]|nr:NAD(P)H-dependent oxidoreductase [Phycisphaerales bacterium]